MPTCLITGASGGVATALASRLRDAGWRLALVTRQPDKLEADPADRAFILYPFFCSRAPSRSPSQ